MGCGKSKINDSDNENETMHKVVSAGKIEKGESNIKTIKNNKIYESLKYYKNQKPSNSGTFIDDIFPPNKNSLFGKDKNGKYIDTSSTRRANTLKNISFKEDEII